MATRHNMADVIRDVCGHVTGGKAGRKSSRRIQKKLRAQLEAAFSLPSLSEAFLRGDDPPNTYSAADVSGVANFLRENANIDYEALHDAFQPLNQHNGCLEQVASIIKEKYKNIGSTLCEDPENLASLRAWVVLLLCPAYTRPDQSWCRDIIVDLADTLIQISKCDALLQALVKWFQEERRLLRRFVKVIHGGFLGLRRSNNYVEVNTMFSYLDALTILNKINEESGCLVPSRLFYVKDVLEKTLLFDIVQQFMLRFILPAMMQNDAQNPATTQIFSWFDFPFLHDVRTKWTFVSTVEIYLMQYFAQMDTPENEARFQFNCEMVRQFLQFSQTGHVMGVPILPLDPRNLVFDNVDRENIVASALEIVTRYNDQGADVWMKPLQVNFGGGEFAVDLGGPSKEFFSLLFAALMDTTKLPIFVKLDEKSVSSAVWFNPDYNDLEALKKIGLLFALLIFNGSIVTVPFPLLLYEKILKRTPFSPNDLNELDPEFADNMDRLRSYSEDDLDNLYLDFNGLQPDGENVLVSEENLEMFIDLQRERKFAINQFASFVKGFDILFNRSRLMRSMFKPEELRDVILGEEFDWKEFERSTLYKPPYSSSHPVIKRFWKVFHAMEESDKRRYLKFQTGADHVPINGFKSLDFTIRRMDTRKEFDACPGEICPAAMTCKGFVWLDLPEYESEDDVRFRLLKALEMSRGFHRERPPSTVVPR